MNTIAQLIKAILVIIISIIAAPFQVFIEMRRLKQVDKDNHAFLERNRYIPPTKKERKKQKKKEKKWAKEALKEQDWDDDIPF